MLPYIIPLILTVLASIHYDWSSHKAGKLFIWFFLYIYMVLLMGLRYKVGGDTLNYMDWHYYAPSLSEWKLFDVSNPYEPGFTLLGSFSRSISKEFWVFELIHAFILNTCIFYFIAKNTKYRFLGLFICFLFYYLYFSTEILRESIAVFVFVLNYKYFEKKQWLKYYISVFVACLFHISAVFLIILPLMRSVKMNQYFLFILGLFLLLMLNLNNVFSIFFNVGKIGDKIQSYDQYTYVGYLWVALRFLQYVVFPVIIYMFGKYTLKLIIPDETVYCMLILLGVGIFFNPVIFSRFTNYLYPLLAISCTNILGKAIASYRITVQMNALILLCFMLVIYGSYYIHLDFYRRWAPYSSYIDPIDYSFRENFRAGR